MPLINDGVCDVFIIPGLPGDLPQQLACVGLNAGQACLAEQGQARQTLDAVRHGCGVARLARACGPDQRTVRATERHAVGTGIEYHGVTHQQGGTAQSPGGQFYAECLDQIRVPDDRARDCVQAEGLAVLAQCVHASICHRGCGTGAAFVAFGFQVTEITVLPKRAPGGRVKAVHDILVGQRLFIPLDTGVAHGVGTALAHGDRREARAHLFAPQDLRALGAPVTGPVGLLGNAILGRAAPVGPVQTGRGRRDQGPEYGLYPRVRVDRLGMP